MALTPAAWQARLRDLEKQGYVLDKAPAGQYARISRGDERVMLEPDGSLRDMPAVTAPQQARVDDVKAELVPAAAVPVQQQGSFEVGHVLGVPKELVVSLNGRMFVTQAGLLIKAERKGGYRSMHAEIVGEIKEGDKVIGYEAKGYIYPELTPNDMEMVKLLPTFPVALQERLMAEIGRPYTAIATATIKNVKMTAMHAYLKEMACTRALNRVLRVYTSCGFCSIEELDDHQEVD